MEIFINIFFCMFFFYDSFYLFRPDQQKNKSHLDFDNKDNLNPILF